MARLDRSTFSGLDTVLKTQDDLDTLTGRMHADHVKGLAREVVKRLSRRMQTHTAPATATPEPAPVDVEALTLSLLQPDVAASARYLQGLIADGVPVPDIYRIHLAAAARLMGEWWNTDRLSFIEVTQGTNRVVALLSGLRPLLQTGRARVGRRALFASVPGEKHTLGTRIAADLVRGEGWEVDLLVGVTRDVILTRIETSDFAVLGLSAHSATSVPELASIVMATRVTDPGIHIMVSGHIVETEAEVLQLTGVDSRARDIESAMETLRRL